MKKLLVLISASIFFLGSGGLAFALLYTNNFPSADSTVIASAGVINADELGYFWSVSRGDSVTETFSGTGLEYVNQLDLEFDVTFNNLRSGAFVDWDVLVEGTKVGDWSWDVGDGTGPVDLSYSFANIFGSGTYEIAMVVTNNVPDGKGSIALGYPGDMTLSGGTAQPVPEPTTMLLFGFGLIGLAGFRRKFKTS